MDCRSSKSGRGKSCANETKKKAKGVVMKAEEEVEVVAAVERKDGGEGFMVVAEVEGLRWSGADEEMTWASCWFPFWEAEANRNAYDSFYEDVVSVWDFDLWGLKGGDDNI